ncbi:MAG TPA: type I 3-dehydroquinate dehydratase [Methanospirillum sp.]|nr:type I 3-dehydroquinate dehydratase [Methanospirillum sp.]
MADGMHQENFIRVAVSLSKPGQVRSPLIIDTDAVEIRLDLFTEPIEEDLIFLKNHYHNPIILTLRSNQEGGMFTGNSVSWIERITPLLPYVTMVDVETGFSEHATLLRDMGKKIIASCHKNEMLLRQDLNLLAKDLKKFGDIAKIAVRPRNNADILTLLNFIEEIEKPIIVSVTGTGNRHARPLLALFGSLYTYSYIDNPTSPGQYSISELKHLGHLLSPGFPDTSTEDITKGTVNKGTHNGVSGNN